ncbi:MAG: glycosyltransferase family 2 protein [Planctomycetaceae bacterium]
MTPDSEPQVTVLIPAFNQERYLSQTIASVVTQTFREPMRIIVLDDGSQDKTLAVARDIAASTPNLTVVHQDNQGRVGARNRLVELATTELLAWLDGDDIAAPNWIEEQVQHLRLNGHIVAVSAQGYAMTAECLPIGPLPRPLSHQEIDVAHLNGEANVFFQSCTTVRKSALISAGAYRDAYSASEDYDLWLRMAELGELENLASCHLLYRVHAASANWTSNVDQRTTGEAILKAARARRRLRPLAASPETIPHPEKDDWNRRLFWINIAARSGNPLTALRLIRQALLRHPGSPLIWLFLLSSMIDSLICFGNRTSNFCPGTIPRPGRLPALSAYALGRRIAAFKRTAFRFLGLSQTQVPVRAD